ncbi:hypothetical protein R5W23_005342 [Gemmata sp. JC673]|uniref:LEPR-XLL domain-containing protein n=1 Tax=Gemmata algarum TaxID=2975278 RepID=A0ABU5FD39_9BACT|nr:hypothetical protein [Gemmata algarum]MDY3563726.1 hypothetical protein [Gemmata algarum]
MNWIDSIRRQLRIGVSSNRSARRASRPQLALTRLEDRVTPTVDTWTGASSNLWSDNGNWLDNSAPTMGEDLVFPASAINKTAVYDSALGVSSFGSIDIQDAATTSARRSPHRSP